MADGPADKGKEPVRPTPDLSPSYLAFIKTLIERYPASHLHLGNLRRYIEKASSSLPLHIQCTQIAADGECIQPNSSAATAGATNASPEPWLTVVKGLPAPETLYYYSQKYWPRPDVLVGYLELERVLRHGVASFGLPWIPPAGAGVVNLCVARLGRFNLPLLHQVSILEQQARAESHVLRAQKALFDNSKYGHLRIRKLNLHNDQYFSIEAMITLMVGNGETRGTGMLLLTDLTDTVDQAALAPWMDFEPCRNRSPALLPSSNFNKYFEHMALTNDDGEHHLATTVGSVLGDLFTPQQRPVEDHLELLHGVIEAILESWVQIVNMMDRYNAPLEMVAPEESIPVLHQLRCNISFLGRLQEYVFQSRQILQSREWSEGHADVSSASANSGDQLIEAHSLLLGRCHRLQQSFQTTSQLLTSAAQAAEAKRGLDQATRIEYLTTLAFLFIPISCVASIYGMNVREILEDNPSVWSFVLTAIGLTIISFSLLYQSSLKRLIRKVHL